MQISSRLMAAHWLICGHLGIMCPVENTRWPIEGQRRRPEQAQALWCRRVEGGAGELRPASLAARELWQPTASDQQSGDRPGSPQQVCSTLDNRHSSLQRGSRRHRATNRPEHVQQEVATRSPHGYCASHLRGSSSLASRAWL